MTAKSSNSDTDAQSGSWSISGWLSETFSVARHEARLLFFAPLTLIFQVWFLLALAICIFLVAGFYETDLANFDLQWTFLPWIALVMAPALAMRSLSESPGDRGLELMMSMPLSSSAIIVGKWLAGTTVLLLTLAMTAPFVFTVGYLGDPDWGLAVSGYFGAALLLAGFYAVAILASAFTRDHVAAYVAGLAALTLLLLPAWGTSAKILGSGPLADFVSALEIVSPKYWLSRMSEGRVELAAIATMTLLTASALAGATLLLKRRRQAQSANFHAFVMALLLSTGALILLSGTARLPYFLDLTAAREFTLHPETRVVAETAPDGIVVDLYYSEDDSKVPARIRQHARRIKNLLQEIASYASGHIKVVAHRTSEDTEIEEAASAAGVRRVPMTSGDSFMLGAVFRRDDRQGVIPYFDEERAELLEYDLALAIDTLGRKKTARIGLLSPLLRATNAQSAREGMAMVEDIKRNYDVAVIPHFADSLPEGLDALVVIDARILKRSMLYAIDQHLMAGRGLIVMLDAYPRFNRANLALKPEPGEEINDISDLLAKYGARYKGAAVVGDEAMAALVTGSDGRQLNYPFWLRAKRDFLSSSHPVTASLSELLFAEPGSFELREKQGMALVTTTSDHSGTLPVSEFKDADSEKLAAQFKPAGDVSHVIAAALSGPFKSAFVSPPEKEASSQGGNDDQPIQPDGVAAPADKGNSNETSPAADTKPHIASTNTAGLFLIADSDWIFDPMALQVVSAGDRTITRPLNDNAAFLINMVEYATGNPRLIGIRSRTSLRRPFTYVANMLKKAQARYRSEEADFVERITGVETAIAKVLETTGAKSADQLPESLLAQIRELRTKLLPYRRELRRIRRSMREDVEALGLKLTLLNLFGGPLLALAFAGLMWRFRASVRLRGPIIH